MKGLFLVRFKAKDRCEVIIFHRLSWAERLAAQYCQLGWDSVEVINAASPNTYLDGFYRRPDWHLIEWLPNSLRQQ